MGPTKLRSDAFSIGPPATGGGEDDCPRSVLARGVSTLVTSCDVSELVIPGVVSVVLVPDAMGTEPVDARGGVTARSICDKPRPPWGADDSASLSDTPLAR